MIFRLICQPRRFIGDSTVYCPLIWKLKKAEKVSDDFHARYDVSGKRYVYRLDLGEFKDPFKRNYTGNWRFPIDIERVQTAMNDFIGEHDFSSFVASGSTARSNVRTIYEANASLEKDANEIRLEFYGNGFLYNMVRIMVGVVVEIGSQMRPEHDILRLYDVKDRDQARRTMPASGLYLKKKCIMRVKILNIQQNYQNDNVNL